MSIGWYFETSLLVFMGKIISCLYDQFSFHHTALFVEEVAGINADNIRLNIIMDITNLFSISFHGSIFWDTSYFYKALIYIFKC